MIYSELRKPNRKDKNLVSNNGLNETNKRKIKFKKGFFVFKIR